MFNAILRQLQRAFKVVQQESEAWQTSLENSSKYLESIINLSEQLQVKTSNANKIPTSLFVFLSNLSNTYIYVYIRTCFEWPLKLSTKNCCERRVAVYSKYFS